MKITKILILVEVEDGTAHQVLTTHAQKEIALNMCLNEKGTLSLDKAVVPFALKYLTP